MKKNRKKKVMFLVLFVSLICGAAITAKAQQPYFSIPEYANFYPNQAANEIETIVSRKAVISSVAEDHQISIDGAAVAQKYRDAVAETDGYVTALENRGMYLNRDLIHTVTVQVTGIDFSEFAEIVIDKENLSQITDVDALKIVLQNQNEFIVLRKESIRAISEQYQSFQIKIKKLSDTYIVQFLDSTNHVIPKYAVDIQIALPATHSNQTVYLLKDNVQENWGGQYNPSVGAMELMTKYSGEYHVASPEIAIDDIDGLSEYEKQAIEFMVVRGYFGLQNRKFYPSSELTRYDFAESLVRMFFALDNEAECTFSDVDWKHYRIVAASQKDQIVQGFSDGTFRGTESVTVEQVIALAARTIHQKNGYVYPENVEKYLSVTNDNPIGTWAEKEVALAVREGIYSVDMKLNFADCISRKDAAVILYRLFMILNNTPDSAEKSEFISDGQTEHKTIWNQGNAMIVCSAVIVINILAILLSVLFLRKKRTGIDIKNERGGFPCN